MKLLGISEILISISNFLYPKHVIKNLILKFLLFAFWVELNLYNEKMEHYGSRISGYFFLFLLIYFISISYKDIIMGLNFQEKAKLVNIYFVIIGLAWGIISFFMGLIQSARNMAWN